MTERTYQPAIKVWEFRDAPAYLRELSTHGGDEDWLAVLPPAYADDPPSWMWSGTGFGVGDVEFYNHPDCDGYKVAIGAHA